MRSSIESEPARYRRSAVAAVRWTAGLAYVALAVTCALLGFNAGSEASAEAGRCLLSDANGSWGIAATAALALALLVVKVPPVKRTVPHAALSVAGGLTVAVWLTHLALLATFGFLLVRPGASVEDNLASLATIPFSIAPTTAIAAAALFALRTRGGRVGSAAWMASSTIACTALAAIAWAISVGRC